MTQSDHHLTLYNTLTKSEERFSPIDPERVTMYNCGPTVYDTAHIGNARGPVVFDVLYRVLRDLYPAVEYARNLTDVDDKIIDRMAAEGRDLYDLTGEMAHIYQQDMRALNCLPPDHEPKCSDYIDEMIVMCERLIENGVAYVAPNDGEGGDHVLFHVPSYPDYGRLSGQSIDELIAGKRVEVAEYKKHPADFVLWKPSPDDEPGWDSPWGRGRPGWHIECSAMSNSLLGQEIDIHTGGEDLIFPHHENETAQSCCATGRDDFAHFWLHNGYITVEGEKMSKSLGNFYTVHDLLDEFPGEAIRLTLLSAQYRQPLDFSKDKIRSAKQTLDKWYLALSNLDPDPERVDNAFPEKVWMALLDDLNTPQAIAHIHELAGQINRARDNDQRVMAHAKLLKAGQWMGILGQDPQTWLQSDHHTGDKGLSDDEIETLITEREAARREGRYGEADAIRDRLEKARLIIEDSDGKTTWRRR